MPLPAWPSNLESLRDLAQNVAAANSMPPEGRPPLHWVCRHAAKPCHTIREFGRLADYGALPSVAVPRLLAAFPPPRVYPAVHRPRPGQTNKILSLRGQPEEL